MTTKCGWCITGDHRNCKDILVYYDKTWICTCECPTGGDDEQRS